VWRILGFFVAMLLVAGCGGTAEEEKPLEKAEGEAGLEEVVEEETRDIHTEGCPEGQISNAAGTECIDEAEAKAKHAPPEEAQRKEAERLVKAFEEGEPYPSSRQDCQIAKAFLDRGQEGLDKMTEDFSNEMVEAISAGEKPARNLEQFLADEGYKCEPPTPAELDKKYEKASEDPKVLEVQCSPQSNASPAFREANC
jgi:hypothetical protein